VPTLINSNAHIKFEMPSFTRSDDMIVAHKLKIGHMTMTMPFRGGLSSDARTYYDESVYPI